MTKQSLSGFEINATASESVLHAVSEGMKHPVSVLNSYGVARVMAPPFRPSCYRASVFGSHAGKEPRVFAVASALSDIFEEPELGEQVMHRNDTLGYFGLEPLARLAVGNDEQKRRVIFLAHVGRLQCCEFALPRPGE